MGKKKLTEMMSTFQEAEPDPKKDATIKAAITFIQSKISKFVARPLFCFFLFPPFSSPRF